MIDFDLPKKLIAQEPARPRDHARLLVYNRSTQKITDDYFYNVLDHLPDPTCVVVNNSKVEHCRLLFNEGQREIFVIEGVNDKTVRALVRPGKVFKLGKVVQLSDEVSARVTAVDGEGIRTIEFSTSRDHPDLLKAQHVPLPPYIAQDDSLAAEYQTIYAKSLGSKAAPTAGLHFTNELKKKVQAKRDWAEITLHVSLGTFAGLTEENYQTGRLHEEFFEISEDTAQVITSADHVTAVGTTSVRTLESNWEDGRLQPGKSSTDIFIQPGYEFKRVNSLITNFHLPGTSLLLLVEAFVGSADELNRIYEHVIHEEFRFYSFGDAMIIV